MLVQQLVLAIVLVIATFAVPWFITSEWPKVLVYEGNGGFDAVSPTGGIVLSVLFALLVVFPIAAFGETKG